MSKRFHVIAWGSDEHPDLDYFTDESPNDLGWKYPCINIALLQPITAAMLTDKFLDHKDAGSQ